MRVQVCDMALDVVLRHTGVTIVAGWVVCKCCVRLHGVFRMPGTAAETMQLGLTLTLTGCSVFVGGWVLDSAFRQLSATLSRSPDLLFQGAACC